MSTLKSSATYRHFNDCRMEGCPGHVMNVSVQTTSDSLTVDVDGKPWLGADPNEWEAFKELLVGFHYYNFDLKTKDAK